MYTDIFKDSEDIICVSQEEYDALEPYYMDKYEIMNMLEDKPRNTIIERKELNHYILHLKDEYDRYDDYHFICPLSASQDTIDDWNEIRWILNNLFDNVDGKERRLFY